MSMVRVYTVALFEEQRVCRIFIKKSRRYTMYTSIYSLLHPLLPSKYLFHNIYYNNEVTYTSEKFELPEKKKGIIIAKKKKKLHKKIYKEKYLQVYAFF